MGVRGRRCGLAKEVSGFRVENGKAILRAHGFTPPSKGKRTGGINWILAPLCMVEILAVGW